MIRRKKNQERKSIYHKSPEEKKNLLVRITPRYNKAYPQDTHLDTTSIANLLSLSNTLSIASRISRALNLLAKGSNSHRLPAANALHLLEELGSRLGGIHISGDIRVEHGALLEDTDTVVVRANSVVGVVQGARDSLVGVDQDVGL
jgi:hypothetical protein